MKQLSLAATDFVKKPKQTRREKFLIEMEAVVPWARLLAVIEPVYPKAGNGRRPYELPVMLRIHFMQQWFNYSDAAMEEALHDIPLLRRFAGLDAGTDTLPDETTILNFRHLLQTHRLSARLFAEVNSLLAEKGLLLREGTTVDATLIAAPGSGVSMKKTIPTARLCHNNEEGSWQKEDLRNIVLPYSGPRMASTFLTTMCRMGFMSASGGNRRISECMSSRKWPQWLTALLATKILSFSTLDSRLLKREEERTRNK